RHHRRGCARIDLRNRRRHAAGRRRGEHLPWPPARGAPEGRRGGVLRHLARRDRRHRVTDSQEIAVSSNHLKLIRNVTANFFPRAPGPHPRRFPSLPLRLGFAWPRLGGAAGAAVCALLPLLSLSAAELKVDLSKERVGRPPATFEPMVGTWVVTKDGADNVIMVDGRPWVASKDNPTKLLIESARRLYGTSNEELMDNAKQFAYFPVAVLKGVDNFTNGTISVKFKTISGDADRASGILFNVKPNGDWLSIRYNDTENNVALWEFHNGMRRNV